MHALIRRVGCLLMGFILTLTPTRPVAAAVMLAVVAPLVVGLLLYVATGAQVAAHPVPFMAW